MNKQSFPLFLLASVVICFLLADGPVAMAGEKKADDSGKDWQNIRVVLAGNYADPTILRDGHDYYLTHSTNNYNPSLLIWHSRDLVHWEALGYALNTPDGNIWAPDLSKVGDTFYIYYPSDGGVHVITAKNPAGPWSKPIDLKLPHQWIDPGFVLGPDGKRYLGLSKGYLVQLADDGLSVIGQPRQIYEGWPVPWDPNRFCGEGQCLEGPKFFHRGAYYYFVSAENGTAGPPTSHMLVVARSKTLEGPWENCPYNPIVHTESSKEPWWSRGHGTIFDTPEGRWYVVYHAYKAGFHTLGRYSLIEPIVWTADGWPTVPKTHDTSDPVLAAPVAPSAEFSDDFKGPNLRYDWQYYGAKTPNMEFGHGLTVQASGETFDKGMFLTYIPRDVSYSVETDVALSAKTAKGGLLLFYSPKHYAGLILEGDGLHFERDTMRFVVKGTQVDRIGLRLENNRNVIKMYYRLPGADWERVDFSYDLSGYNHNTFGDFDSLRPALTASGSGAVTFHQFIYKPMESAVP